MAMAALMRELLPYAGRICGAIALDDGDDALQETMVAVLRALPALREPAALRGWVRRIAVRESLRVVRARPDTAQWSNIETVGTDVDIDASLDVARALAGMSPEHRAVLVLRDLDAFNEEEVAELLSIPIGTVKSRLHRARVAFRARWLA
jgi:RNA polymerase sigma-70 factor (ECF subfamily)